MVWPIIAHTSRLRRDPENYSHSQKQFVGNFRAFRTRLTFRESYSVIFFVLSCGSPFLIRYDGFVRVLKITAIRKKHSWVILGLIMRYCCTYHHQLPSEVGLRGVSPPSLNFSNILQCVIVCPTCPPSFWWIILYLIRFGTLVNLKIHVR
jgi:hypothetical protein